MKTMKRAAALGLAAAMAASTLAMTPVFAEENSDRITISVIGVDWGYGPLPDSEMEQYWEDMFDVNLDIQWINYENYHSTVNTLIATGNVPDVLQIYKMENQYYYPVFTQAIESGVFLDMKDILFADGEGLAETNAVMKNWDEDMWSQATYNGGIYILPRSKAEIAQQSGINVRRDLMETYGFTDEPTTMDELKTWLIDLSNAATEGEGQKIYALQFAGEDFMASAVKAFAIAFTGQEDWGIDENGEFQYMQFNENYLDFLNWMKDLYDAGVIDPEFALGNTDTSKWKAGNSVAYLNAWYNWNQSEDKTSNKIFDSNTPDTYEAWCLLPVEGPNGKTVDVNSSDIDSCIAISASCDQEKIDKIMQVFNATEEDYPGYDLLLSDGVEGVHYTVQDDGTRLSDETQGQKKTEGYVGAWNQIFLKTDADQITAKFMRTGTKRASDESIARAQEIKAAIQDYIAESGLTYANTNLVSETYNNSWSEVVADVNAMCTQYVMGEFGEDEWKSYIQELVESDTYKTIQAEFKAAAEAAAE